MSKDAAASDPTSTSVKLISAAALSQSQLKFQPESSSTAVALHPTVSESFQVYPPGIEYVQYSLSLEATYLPQIRELISRDLSEPYSIYVYRYFLYQWAELCFIALDTTTATPSSSVPPSEESEPQPQQSSHRLAGVVICKLEPHRGGPLRGYIAMLATEKEYRGKGIATTLVSKAIDLMIEKDADEIALETEETNTAAMHLYEKLGFLRSKKLHRYYLNGNSAYRLLLYLKPGVGSIPTQYDWSPEMPPSAQGDEFEGSGEYDEVPNEYFGMGIV